MNLHQSSVSSLLDQPEGYVVVGSIATGAKTVQCANFQHETGDVTDLRRQYGKFLTGIVSKIDGLTSSLPSLTGCQP